MCNQYHFERVVHAGVDGGDCWSLLDVADEEQSYQLFFYSGSAEYLEEKNSLVLLYEWVGSEQGCRAAGGDEGRDEDCCCARNDMV